MNGSLVIANKPNRFHVTAMLFYILEKVPRQKLNIF
jgi:hypothetical protein